MGYVIRMRCFCTLSMVNIFFLMKLRFFNIIMKLNTYSIEKKCILQMNDSKKGIHRIWIIENFYN